MNRGYIKIYRKIFDHWLWDDSPKSKFEAWVLLLKMANHEDKKIMFNGSMIEVKTGDILTSEVKLSSMLKWSRTKVRKFLDTLSDDKMIVQKKDSKKTYLSICNYKEYHHPEKEKEQVKNSKKTSKKHNEELLSTKKETIPPNFQEVSAYCQERKNGIDPQNFIDHYEANGWMRGKTKIKSWKACIRTWEKNNKPTPQKQLYATFND